MTLNGYAPIYTYYGGSIYASDVVQQALKCIADEMLKLKPLHIIEKGTDPTPVTGSLQNVLNRPNPLMTTAEFIEKITWLLLLNYNAFIIPVYRTWTDEETGQQRRRYEELWPIKPTQADFIEDASGRLFVKFFFATGYNTTIPYDDVIHLKYNYSVNEYMGGDQFGQPDNEAILKTLELNGALLNGIAKAMNSSYAVNGIVKYNTMMDDGKMEANIRELERKLQNSQSGLLPIDLKAEFVPFPRQTQLVDEATLKFIDEKILRNWGIPLPILTGDYTKEQYEAFYQKTLEPLIITYGQAFSQKLFTSREAAFGNKIRFYPKDLVFMTTQQKLELVNILAPTGAVYENEKRAMFGLMPLPELEGKRYMSLNWVDADIAQDYQMGKIGNVQMDVIDETKDETITEE
jgi:HK97 family phage portal protein